MGGYVRITLTVYMSKAEMSRRLLKGLDILCPRRRKKERIHYRYYNLYLEKCELFQKVEKSSFLCLNVCCITL